MYKNGGTEMRGGLLSFRRNLNADACRSIKVRHLGVEILEAKKSLPAFQGLDKIFDVCAWEPGGE